MRISELAETTGVPVHTLKYYLRAAPEKGDIQVNLADKHHRSRQSHEIAVSLRGRIEAIGRKNGGVAKVVEVPPGPPVVKY